MLLNIRIILFFLVLIFISDIVYSQKTIKHFIFFGRDRENIHNSRFLNNPYITGAQTTYPWRLLEPEKDGYSFDAIQQDLIFLKSKRKKLFVQLQDVSFDTTIINVPKYLMTDPIYNGGADVQYSFINDNENKPVKEGWVARRWDPEVRKRFHKLLFELGKEFDGKIAGINLPESAVDFGSGTLHPKGFTYLAYRDAILSNMKALKESFPNSVTIQYINFMPGEFLPWENKSLLKSLFDYAKEIKVGVGGPDLLVYKKSQMNNSYGFINKCQGIIPTGIAVQWNNYKHINPQTGKRVTIQEIYRFATDYLGLNYIFWCTQEPYYSKELIPFLLNLKQQK